MFLVVLTNEYDLELSSNRMVNQLDYLKLILAHPLHPTFILTPFGINLSYSHHEAINFRCHLSIQFAINKMGFLS